MARSDEFGYREVTRPAAWIWLIIWGACLASLMGVGGKLLRIIGRDGMLGLVTGEGPTYLATAAILAALPFVFQWLFGRLTVGVAEDEVVAHFGSGPIRKRIPFGHIKDVRATTYNPLREFGGWGIRGFGKKRAWTVGGDQAVVLHLRDGVQLYLGCSTPLRLKERIETAMRLQPAEES